MKDVINYEQLSLPIKEGFNVAPIPRVYGPVSRMMFYLNCVDTALNIGISKSFKDFRNPDGLSREDVGEVVRMVEKLSPDLLKHNSVFIQKDELCPNCTNEFYEAEGEIGRTCKPKPVPYCGKTYSPLYVMAFREEFVDDFYDRPFGLIAHGNESPACSRCLAILGQFVLSAIFVIIAIAHEIYK